MEKNFQMIWIEIKKFFLNFIKRFITENMNIYILYNQQIENKSNSNLL